MQYYRIVSLFMTVFAVSVAEAKLTVPVYLTAADGQREAIGQVTLQQAACGVLITPDLHGLPPGVHGFHVHQHASCDDHGMAAGSHFDPKKTDKHEGPYQPGHLGDLPVLVVAQDGSATLPVLAPGLRESTLVGHTLMIHAGGDNYSDSPEKLGGGGARIACGVIEK